MTTVVLQLFCDSNAQQIDGKSDIVCAILVIPVIFVDLKKTTSSPKGKIGIFLISRNFAKQNTFMKRYLSFFDSLCKNVISYSLISCTFAGLNRSARNFT